MNAQRRHLPFKALLLVTAAALGLAAVTPAEAQHRSRARVGVWIGGPVWGPGYWGPGYWGPSVWGPGYGVGYSRPIIIQQPAPEPLVVAPNMVQNHAWYYCHDSKMYFPHVRECATPWQEVPAGQPQ